MPACVGTYLHLQTVVHAASLRGDHDHALGSAAAIEHHCLGSLQEGDFLNLGRQYVVGVTGYTVDKYEYRIGDARLSEAPHRGTVESSHVALHVVKTIRVVVLVHQVSVVQTGDTTHDVFLGHLAESHLHLGRVSSIYLCFDRHCCRQSQEN